MVAHTLEILEFNKIVQSISEYAISEAGKQLLFEQKVETDEKKWKEKIDAVFEIKKIFDDSLYLPELSLPDINSIIKKVFIDGTVLDAFEVGAVIAYLQFAFKLQKFLLQNIKNSLIQNNLDFPEETQLVKHLSKFISPAGVIREENIKILSDIKSKISRVNKTIDNIIGKYTNDPLYSSYMQDTNPTLRDNRVVIPLKENFKGKIKGIIHGSSARGMTLFVEPVELFEYNNEVTELEEQYKIEIHKILRELTAQIREKKEEINNIFYKISFLDTIIARAYFAFKNNCILPERIKGTLHDPLIPHSLGHERASTPRLSLHSEITKGLMLKNARHFLLGKKAVPIDIIITGDTKALLISGPNTGGKTVSLKTAGLAVLMNQFSVGIIADEGSGLSFYNNVLADIGDEQSITSSLSTFSAHMKNISEIISLSTENTLVLLDEPGTGTDPDEGAALAMAIFDTLLGRNVNFLATTHQATLKNYAAEKEDIMNVSVAYNSETYKTEYKILYGLPGESFGIDIAEKNNLENSVIEKARKYVGSEKVNINKLIKEIGLKQQELANKEAEIKEKEKSVIEARREIGLKELSLRQKEYEIRNAEKRSLNIFLKESRQKIENIIRKVIEEKASEEAKKDARDFIQEIENQIEESDSKIENDIQEYIKSDEKIEPGTEIYIGENKQRGEVIRVLKNNKYLVSTGSLKVEVGRNEIFVIKGRSKKDKVIRPEVLRHDLNKSEKPLFELDLRGLRAEEAISRLETQLDSALINGFSTFSVIHGHGEGVLRNLVAEYLAASPAVKKFYHAHPESGGFGKTVVEL
ncbi:MAG: Smr/MutS family protein [Spirochaetes bacterium]|nr:Smr/MutS family protein [Spirochaetota bacterium]